MRAERVPSVPVVPDGESRRILTPDQRLRVFVSSTLEEVAPERAAAREAIAGLRLTPVLFELGARPHSPQALYRSYLEQSHVFVAVYWQSYGWLAPGAEVSGLEDEYLHSADKPRLVYVKEPAAKREPRLNEFLARLRQDGGVSYKKFQTAEELGELLAQDLAVLVSERFRVDERAGVAAPRTRGLPAQSTSFVGRTHELSEIERLLGGGVRLLTLTGPAGIGKTRVAVEAAERLRGRNRDGVVFVPLDGIESAELVTAAISSALGVRDVGLDPLGSVVAHLGSRSLLLLLDNFEHVIAAAPVVSALLEGAPELTVLVTSRELLRLRGEYELPVPPLAPEAEAAILFAERAEAVVHAFELGAADLPLVTEICRRLDGVPLAIELAAPRLRLLTPEQLLEALRGRFAFTGPRDAPARQRTLRAAIAWSYELLEDDERRLFQRLSVFRGSFPLDAAAAVCGECDDAVELLGSLLDKSIVYRVPEERGSRFAMLSMIREFAEERLDAAGERDAAFEALTGFYLEYAARMEQGIRSTEQRAWKRLIDLEADTLRVELGWLAEHRRDDELVSLLRGLWLWYWLSGRLEEGRAWVKRALPYADRLSVEQRAWIFFLDGAFAFFQAELEAASERLAQARSLFVETGERLGLATIVAIAAFASGSLLGKSAALEGLDQALGEVEQLGDAWGTAGALSAICRIRSIFGDFEGAGEVFERGLVAAERAGDDLLTALALTNLADYSFAHGEPDASRRYIDRALTLLHATGVRFAAPDLLETLARIEAAAGDDARAAELVGSADVLRETMHVPLWGPIATRHASFVDELRGALGTATFDEIRERGRALPLDHWIEASVAQA